MYTVDVPLWLLCFNPRLIADADDQKRHQWKAGDTIHVRFQRSGPTVSRHSVESWCGERLARLEDRVTALERRP